MMIHREAKHTAKLTLNEPLANVTLSSNIPPVLNLTTIQDGCSNLELASDPL